MVGLATAVRLQQLQPSSRILILEKESRVAAHQSGHNSGVIHSGIYYKPGSLKAKNCLAGYRSIIRFAEEYGIDYDLCGKIIVATNEAELPLLENIYRRGLQNGLSGLEKLAREEFREWEPHCEGLAAVRVPQTGIIDFPALARKLAELFQAAGGRLEFGQEVMGISENIDGVFVQTRSDEWTGEQLISCGGLYSDALTSMTSDKNDLMIIPFRGEYYKLRDEKKHLVKNLIYPVPSPDFPFLGVHFTRMIGGEIEAGPNAVLALRKEGYDFFDIDRKELLQTIAWPGFRKIVRKYGRTGLGEIHRSLSKKAFTKALRRLVPELTEEDLIRGGAGVRAQACDRQGKLLDDFDILRQGRLIHVRNAPSPAATSCLAIGEYISRLALPTPSVRAQVPALAPAE